MDWGLSRLPRNPEDEPQIVETWLWRWRGSSPRQRRPRSRPAQVLNRVRWFWCSYQRADQAGNSQSAIPAIVHMLFNPFEEFGRWLSEHVGG